MKGQGRVPFLFSLNARAALGLTGNLAKGAGSLPNEGEVELCRCIRYGHLVIRVDSLGGIFISSAMRPLRVSCTADVDRANPSEVVIGKDPLVPSVAVPLPPRRVDLDHGEGERPAAAMADDDPAGAIPILLNASVLTMGFEDFVPSIGARLRDAQRLPRRQAQAPREKQSRLRRRGRR